ncbi:MAG: type VI secretion system contractile sheath large subunit [Planctomycetota bacterium]|nr:type VI secretion system contractile sheath large subunit [Planctomycetota bacterium]
MTFTLQFGQLDSKPKDLSEIKKFRIAVLGDFSGRGNTGDVEVGAAMAAKRGLKVDSDTIDEMIERCNIKLLLPAGPEGALLEVAIECLDDFHPDQLYESIPLFEKLVNLRGKLQDSASYDKAVSALRSLAIEPAAKRKRQTSSSVSIPRKRLDSLDDLLQQEYDNAEPSDLKRLLRNVVGPHIQPSMQDQASMIAAVDSALSELMCTILHHPDFQAIESIWRSIELMVHRLELDHQLELVLFDISAAEFAADLASSGQLEETGLYKLLVEYPSQDNSEGPFSVVLGNYLFEKIPPHAEILGRVAQLAANANFAFLSSIDKNVIDIKPGDDEPEIVASAWRALSGMPQANYVGLMSPRFMLRWPYGKKTEPIDSFEFEEFSRSSGIKGMLWGNATILAGVLLGRTCTEQGIQEMKLDSILTVDDLPFYYYNDEHGDQVALPCTERLIGESLASNLTYQSFVSVLAMKGANHVRVAGFRSLTGEALAGIWGQRSPEERSAAAPATESGQVLNANPTSASPPKEVGVQVGENEVPETGSDGDLSELDDLLADLHAPAPSTGSSAQAQAPSDDGLEELDNLLADLDAADDAPLADDGIDDELAELLNDL